MTISILHAYDGEMRSDPPIEPGEFVERVDGLVRLRGSHNLIIYSRLEAKDAASVVAKQAAFFREIGEKVEWKLYAHDRPANLAEVLEMNGFEPDERETLMVLDLTRKIEFAASPRVDVRAVRTTSELDTYVAVSERAFGSQEKTAAADLAMRIFGNGASTIASIAYVDGRPAAAGRLELPTGRSFASMWGGGTDPELRKRGVYRTLVAERVRAAREHGYAYLTVDALDTSRPILERLGFAPLTTVRAWNFVP